MGMLIEAVRYTVTNGRTTEVRQFRVEGPTAELEKQIAWAASIDRKDGWYIVNGSVKFGTIQAGEFVERKTRRVPMFAFDGYRRMSSFLRA